MVANRRRIIENYKNPQHPTSFGGINKLQKFYGISQTEARKILSGISSYTLHREGKKPHKRNPFFVYVLRQQIQMDLIEVGNIAAGNDGIRYILTAIDIFSKFLVCVPMKRKTAAESLRAVRIMVNSFNPKPEAIMSDNGQEFMNASVQNYLRDQGIKHFTPENDLKCVVVERVNKTIQRRIYQYRTDRNIERYIDALPQLVAGYNNTEHRSIGMKPKDAEKPENHLKVRDSLNRHYFSISPKSPTLKVGDVVRLKTIGLFHRSYFEQNTSELWEIVEVDTEMPIPRYYVKSLENLERLKAAFYSNELTLVDVDRFPIETILRRRTYRGVRQVYVKWQGYNEAYNTWIPEANVQDL